MNKTFSLKQGDVARSWVVVDASEAPLGRVATMIATRLIGKYKPTYTPHMDDGDYVVVVNAASLITTGNKDNDKVYYSYSGYPSGLKEKKLSTLRQEKPEDVITKAVKGMLPKNKLVAERMNRLKVYAGAYHAHAAQKPVAIGVKK